MSKKWLTVSDAVEELSGTVSEETVRRWCRNRLIEGVTNIANGKNNVHYRIPRNGWDQFLASRRMGLVAPLPTVRQLLSRPGTNHIGV